MSRVVSGPGVRERRYTWKSVSWLQVVAMMDDLQGMGRPETIRAVGPKAHSFERGDVC